MEEPEEINIQELMEYYGYSGSFGVIKFYFRYTINWILQTMAKICPHFGRSVKLQG